MKIRFDLSLTTRQLLATLPLMALSACSDGIDRPSSANSGGSSNVTLDDDAIADASYVRLHKLDDEVSLPSVISVLFQATDRNGLPVETLTLERINLSEDGSALPAGESASRLVDHAFLPLVLDTVVMLDISSSMSTNDLATMKQAVHELVRDPGTGNSRLFSGQRVALYTFDESFNLVKDFSYSAEHIVDALDSISLPVGIMPTDLYGSVKHAVTLWDPVASTESIRDGAVIVITDGTDTAGRSSLSSAEDTIGDNKVFTIGVGDSVDEEALARLGTAGSYLINSYDELAGILATIRDKLTRYSDSYYLLQYASPKRAAEGRRSNSDHDYRISLLNNDNNGSSSHIDGDFNAYDFSSVSPQVEIGGAAALEAGQTASYLADTLWPVSSADYNWQINGECALNSNNGASISVTATNAGTCRLSVTDNGNYGTNATLSVPVSGN